MRASLWSAGDEITDRELKTASFVMPNRDDHILGRELGNNFNIQELISKVKKHYIDRALIQSAGNKKKATNLLGLANYQTLKNWIDKNE